MKNRSIYKIQILGWEKHNPNRKKHYKYTLIANNFFDDAKVMTLSRGGQYLYLRLLLACGDVGQSYIEATYELLVRYCGGSGHVAKRLLSQLQSLQLVSYEELQPLMNRIELNRSEEKRIEVNNTSEVALVEKPPVKKRPPKEDREQNSKIWETYANAFRQRYAVDPVRNVMVNSQVSNLRKRLGVDEACKVVEFYLTHNDSFYLKNTHSFGLCLNNAETLRTQMLRGKPITNTMVKSFEKENSSKEVLERLSAKWDAQEKARGGKDV